MSFSLDPTSPVPETVRNAAAGQLEGAVAALTGEAGLDPDAAAHDARKRSKKVRGLLLLVRHEVGGKVYRRENAAVRDAARHLSGVRDAWVLVQSLDAVVARSEAGPPAESVAGLRAVLVRAHEQQLEPLAAGTGAVDDAVSAFAAAAARVPDWPLRDRGWAAFGGGLEAVFKRGRQDMALAYRHGSVEYFHDWRKYVKYLRYQLGLVRRAWPEVLDAMEATADELGELLGEDHDLAVLRDRVLLEAATSEAAQEALLAAMDRRRTAIQSSARPLGRRLYAEKPAAFARRLGRLWDVAASTGERPAA